MWIIYIHMQSFNFKCVLELISSTRLFRMGTDRLVLRLKSAELCSLSAGAQRPTPLHAHVAPSQPRCVAPSPRLLCTHCETSAKTDCLYEFQRQTLLPHRILKSTPRSTTYTRSGSVRFYRSRYIFSLRPPAVRMRMGHPASTVVTSDFSSCGRWLVLEF